MRRNTADWNFIANVMDGALFSLAMSFVSQQTILPLFVQKLGGGNVAVGLIPVIWILGFNLPQILAAPYAQRQTRKKALLLRTAMLQRIPWLLLAIAAATLPGGTGGGAVVVFLVLLALAAVGGSVNLPVWFDLIAKLTPVEQRGRLFGARSMLGSLLGIGGGAVATVVLSRLGFPGNFSVLFLLAFGVMMVSYLFLVSLRESTDSIAGRSLISIDLVRSLPSVLRSHTQFRRFLVADALLMSATMATAFYAVHGVRKFSLPDSSAGEFTMVMMAGGIAGSLLFGPLADRFGHRLNLLSSAASTILACTIAVVAPTPLVHGAVFIFSALSVSLAMISRLPFLAEIVPEAERPSMVALANLLTSPFVLWGVAAGWIANIWGTTAVFALAALFAGAALAWTLWKIGEPRVRSIS